MPGGDGARAEALAARYLERRGCRVVARNVRSRFGEIDLVVRDGDTLVFVEVRLRRSSTFGGAAASITAAKQEKLVKTAQGYLANMPSPPPCRFDAVLLDRLDGGRVDWIRNIVAVE